MDGVCPSCGVSWPAVDVCQVCGEPATLYPWWKLLGMGEPRVDGLATLAALAVELAEISPGEAGLTRRDVTQLLFLLYGHRYKQIPLLRWFWRTLLSQYFGARSLGEKRAQFDIFEEAEKNREAQQKSSGVRR